MRFSGRVESFHSNVRKAESTVNIVNHTDAASYFRFDLIFGTENVGIILGESTHTHQAV